MQSKYGIVHFDSDPRGAEIIVDGQVLINSDTEESIKTPATVELLEGRRDFVLILDGYEDAVGYVDVLADTTVDIFKNLISIPGSNIRGGQEEEMPRRDERFTEIPRRDERFTEIPRRDERFTEIPRREERAPRREERAPRREERAPRREEREGGERERGGHRSLQQNHGSLTIYSDPDNVDAYVNGSYVGKTPLLVTNVPAGVVKITWKMPGMMDEEKIVDIVEDAHSNAYATMRPIIPKHSIPGYPGYYYGGKFMSQNEDLGYTYVYSYPEGATICIDGNIITDGSGNLVLTPATVTLPIGDHEVALSIDGYFTGYDTINIYYPGEETCVSINLSEKILEIPHEYGSVGNITISSYPEGATICIDGSAVTDESGNQLITPATVTLLEGYHDIELDLQGYFDGYEYVYVYPGADLDVSITLSEKVLTLQQKYAPESPDIPCVFPESPNQTATQGSVVVTTYPYGGIVILDGKTIVDLDTGAPITTPVQIVMTMGYHDLMLRLDGFYDEFAGLYITPGHISYVHRNFNVC